jgi:hypothetical protein
MILTHLLKNLNASTTVSSAVMPLVMNDTQSHYQKSLLILITLQRSRNAPTFSKIIIHSLLMTKSSTTTWFKRALQQLEM